MSLAPTTIVGAAQMAAALAVAAVSAAVAFVLALSPTPRKPLPSERQFRNVLADTGHLPFPLLSVDTASMTTATAATAATTAPSNGNALRQRTSAEPEASARQHVSLSVVVPAYCEEARLPIMLEETLGYLDARLAANPATFSYEVIIVDDGSKDSTTQVALSCAKSHLAKKLALPKGTAASATANINALREIRVMTFERNRGKGGAVAQGILASRGDLVLFADADGATRFSDVEGLEREIRAIATPKRNLGVAIGSRAHMVNTEAVVKRSFIRNFLMRGFHMLVYLLGIRSIRDTQCGFKMFTRGAAARIFTNMHVEGWIFDIEVLILASKCGIPIAEVPVTWHEVDGTKMSLLRDSIQMLVQLVMIRLNYLLGFWSIPKDCRQ
ncbi:nucleotide-diphospho-sugar transferase [Entophlyctis helioformis]|nr:nucleotide-diphospho-sugar transferase [Entophlyctis helioformis]